MALVYDLPSVDQDLNYVPCHQTYYVWWDYCVQIL